VKNRFHVITIWLFPIVLAVGILTIPVVSDYSNHVIAEQAVGQTGRWFWGHLISAVAFGLASLAAFSINRYLSKRGQANLGMSSLILVTTGSALYAFGLGADGIGPIASIAGGGRASTFFEGSGMWVSGVFITASVILGLGFIVQTAGLNQAGILKGPSRIIAMITAFVFIGATAIPSGWGLYGVAATALVLYGLIGKSLWCEH
jgi:hypothetical protein